MDAGSLKQEIHELKLTVALDVAEEEDAKLLEFMRSVPDGFKGLVVRRLLLQSLPKTELEQDALFGKAAVDALNRGRVRGRPRKPSGKAVLPSTTKSRVQAKTPSSVVVAQTPSKVVDETVPLVPTPLSPLAEPAVTVAPEADTGHPSDADKEIEATSEQPGGNALKQRLGGLVSW